MNYWVTKYTSLYVSYSSNLRVCWMDIGTIVSIAPFSETINGRVRVVYKASKPFVGWVEHKYIEEIFYSFPSEGIAVGQTDSEQDAAQYIVTGEGHVLYNLCGEMCVASIFGDNITTFRHNFLNKWISKPVSRYNQIIYGGKSKTTGVDDLLDMASCYSSVSLSMKDVLWDKEASAFHVTPLKLRNILVQGWKGIFGVKIEGRRGELRSNGSILHWIVVLDVQPDGINDGWVTIYNPFPDRRKVVPWFTFTSAMGIPSGVFLKTSTLEERRLRK